MEEEVNSKAVALLANLTIVILSKDRQQELKLTLDYWSQFPVSIVVAHDSQKPLEIKAAWKNVTYLSSSLDVVERLALADNYVSTQYVMLGNDDEIFLPTALFKLLEVLEEKPEIESAAGQVIAYSWAGKKLLGLSIYEHLRRYSNLDGTPYKRASVTLDSKNLMDLTSIYRREVFRLIVRNVKNFSGYSTPYMYEMMFALFSSLFCRAVRLPNIYWARNWHTPYQQLSSTWDRRLTWDSWCTSPHMAHERLRWKLLVSRQLKVINGLSESEVVVIISKLMRFTPLTGVKSASSSPTLLKYLIRTIRRVDFFDFLSWKTQTLIPHRKQKIMLDFNSLVLSENSNVAIAVDDLMKLLTFVSQQRILVSH